MLEKLKQRSQGLKQETVALYLACRDKQTPLAAKMIAAAVVAYALSPIDLIPDFIPVIGVLDDLLLIPLGISFAIRLIPQPVMERCRHEAGIRLKKGEAGGRTVSILIVVLWLAVLALAFWLIYRAFLQHRG